MKRFCAGGGLAIVLLALAAYVTTSEAWEDAPEMAAVDRIAREITDCLRAGDTQALFAALKEHLHATQSELDQLEVLLEHQRESISPRFGRRLGEVELVRREERGKSFVRLVFVEKWERSALVWRLTFYKPAQEWHLNGFAWDDKVESLFAD